MLGITPGDITSGRVLPDDRDIRWILHELVPISAREALAKAPWQRGARGHHPHLGRAPVNFYYRCTLYDPEERICTAWEDRPNVCRLFPEGTPGWPEPSVALPPACSFHADCGREPAPVPVRIKIERDAHA